MLFIDLQPAIVARSNTIPPAAPEAPAAALAEVAGVFVLPVTVGVVPEGDGPPSPVPAPAEAVGDATLRVHSSASAFFDASTRDALAASGRRTLPLSGFAAGVAVLHACADAVGAGHRVHVPVDACGGMGARTEDAAFRRIEARGAGTTSVVSVATALAPDFTTDRGRAMFRSIQKLRLA